MSEPIRTRRTSEIRLAEGTYGAPHGLSRSRVSWGAALSGLFVALSVQLLINQIMVWGNFGLGKVLAPGDIASHTTAIGLWLALSAAVGVLAGSIVASRVANARGSGSGLLHGATVWGLTVVSSVFFSTIGAAAIMGFGITPHTIASYFGPSGTAGAGLGSVIRNLSGWFLVQVVASLVLGMGGGFAAARRGTAAIEPSMVEDEEYEARRAA
jgi:hypothetical protein